MWSTDASLSEEMLHRPRQFGTSVFRPKRRGDHPRFPALSWPGQRIPRVLRPAPGRPHGPRRSPSGSFVSQGGTAVPLTPPSSRRGVVKMEAGHRSAQHGPSIALDCPRRAGWAIAQAETRLDIRAINCNFSITPGRAPPSCSARNGSAKIEHQPSVQTTAPPSGPDGSAAGAFLAAASAAFWRI